MPRTVPCAGCRKPIQHGPTSRPEGQARCRTCQRAEVDHGTVAMYAKRGCRCVECKRANAAAVRDFVAKRREEGRPVKKVRSKNRGNRYDLNKDPAPRHLRARRLDLPALL